MGRRLTPAAIAAAMLAFATAALTAGVAVMQPQWWRAAVHLAILGGIIPMIFAVNLRILPVFSRRAWPAPAWLRVQMLCAIAGPWLLFIGIIAAQRGLEVAGNAVALVGGILFVSNLLRLFRQPATLPAPPLPYPGQTAVDAIGIRFMQLSTIYLLFGLATGLMMSFRELGPGRWELVWTHTMLIGFFLSMVSGVCYHALSRWTGRQWRSVTPIRAHFGVLALGLPVMLHALGAGDLRLFAIAGPLQALAIGLLLWNIAPMVPALPGLTRPAFTAAILLLATGVTLGALFALDPGLGARLRLAHAEINLFGWSGLLISGAGYYLVPRFAGQPLRWPRLAVGQLAALVGGVVLGALAVAWRTHGEAPVALPLIAQTLVAAGYLLFAAIMLGTFRPRRRNHGTVAALPLLPRPSPS